MTGRAGARVGRGRLALFAVGDFALNLYWQSVTLFLLFFYTDALGLPMAVAALGYTIASIWDGIASLLAGLAADRLRAWRGFHVFLIAGSAPLGASFVLLYLPVPTQARWAGAAVIGCHLLFRTLYAGVSIPYAAMSVRISPDGRDRQIVSGLRMAFGNVAAVLVSVATVPVGGWLSSPPGSAGAYLAAAVLFAAAGTAVLALVGLAVRDRSDAAPPAKAPIRDELAGLARNRAYLLLNLAMMAMIVGVTVLAKSVLYYFKYVVGDLAAGQLALVSMAAVSAVAVPVWVVVSGRIGLKAIWLLLTGAGSAGLLLFAVVGPRGATAAQGFLVAMQAIAIGLHFAFWAMLPNAIDYGEHATGLRGEGLAYGVAALLQRVAIGIATAILGLGFGTAGYVANACQSADTLAAMRLTIVLVPLASFVLSGLLMARHPLRRGVHARVARALAERRAPAR